MKTGLVNCYLTREILSTALIHVDPITQCVLQKNRKLKLVYVNDLIIVNWVIGQVWTHKGRNILQNQVYFLACFLIWLLNCTFTSQRHEK